MKRLIYGLIFLILCGCVVWRIAIEDSHDKDVVQRIGIPQNVILTDEDEIDSVSFSLIFEPQREYVIPTTELAYLKQFFMEEIRLTNAKRYKGGPFISYKLHGRDGTQREVSFILITGEKPRFMVQNEKNDYMGDVDVESAMKFFKRTFTKEICERIMASEMLKAMPYSSVDFSSLNAP